MALSSETLALVPHRLKRINALIALHSASMGGKKKRKTKEERRGAERSAMAVNQGKGEMMFRWYTLGQN